KCPRDAGVASLAQAVLDVPLHALILREVLRDEVCGLVRTDAQLLRKTKRRLTINDAEVHRLGTIALLRRDGINRQTEHCRSCPAMNILSGRECFSQPLVSRKVRKNAKFDL